MSKSNSFAYDDEERQEQSESVPYTEHCASASPISNSNKEEHTVTTETYHFSEHSLSTYESDQSSNESSEGEKLLNNNNRPIFDFAPEIKDGIIFRGDEKENTTITANATLPVDVCEEGEGDPQPACFINLNNKVSTTEPELVLFGFDLSHFSPSVQFGLSASGVLVFNMCYGYLQELIQIQIAGRSFAIFLGACQFLGYAFWSGVLSRHGSIKMQRERESSEAGSSSTRSNASPRVYFALSVLRSVDLALTNLSMKFLNYPAKTLVSCKRRHE